MTGAGDATASKGAPASPRASAAPNGQLEPLANTRML
jgi:hypothetical protein